MNPPTPTPSAPPSPPTIPAWAVKAADQITKKVLLDYTEENIPEEVEDIYTWAAEQWPDLHRGYVKAFAALITKLAPAALPAQDGFKWVPCSGPQGRMPTREDEFSAGWVLVLRGDSPVGVLYPDVVFVSEIPNKCVTAWAKIPPAPYTAPAPAGGTDELRAQIRAEVFEACNAVSAGARMTQQIEEATDRILRHARATPGGKAGE